MKRKIAIMMGVLTLAVVALGIATMLSVASGSRDLSARVQEEVARQEAAKATSQPDKTAVSSQTIAQGQPYCGRVYVLAFRIGMDHQANEVGQEPYTEHFADMADVVAILNAKVVERPRYNNSTEQLTAAMGWAEGVMVACEWGAPPARVG